MANMGVPSHCIREEASAEGNANRASVSVVDAYKNWRRRVDCGENMYGSPKTLCVWYRTQDWDDDHRPPYRSNVRQEKL